MSFSITNPARQAATQVNEQPQLVLSIEGVPTLYGMVTIDKIVKIGDTGLTIGGGWKIGGLTAHENQQSIINVFGNSTQITQTLNQDKGIGSSVSSVTVNLVDKDQQISKLISPGQIVTDVLGRRCKLYLGFAETAYPDDYIVLFRGIIDEIDSSPGNCSLILVHPDRKKLQVIYPKCSPSLNGAINNSVTSLTVSDSSNMLQRVLGPDGSTYDPAASFYIQIDSEIIKYTTISGNNITGCTRGQLGTSAAAHSDGASTNTFYRIADKAMTLALKLMLSGWGGPFKTGVAATNFVYVDSTLGLIDNALYFDKVDLAADYGLTVGDYLTTSGASNGANNVSNKAITDIVKTDNGSYAILSGVTFVDERATAGVVAMRSQYDTLGDGLQMYPDEVDVAAHLRLYRLFLSSFSYDIYLKDDVDAKTFLDDEIYNPCASYSIPRKGQASVGYHIGPIPTDNIVTIGQDNIINPKQIKLQRSASKNFFNTVIYQFDEDVLTTDFKSGDLAVNATSQTQIPVGNKAMIIPSKGIRTSLSGVNQSQIAATRRLNRYAFGAEFFKGIQLSYRAGFTIEIGDIVILDSTNLFITDTKTGTRNATTKLYEVVNKTLDYKTGKISLDLVDTNYSTASRYALIGPASYIKSGLSATQFIIQKSFASIFGENEYLKWSRYTNCPVKVRSVDSSVTANSTIKSIAGNQITLATSLGFTPSTGYLMELAKYTLQTDQVKIRNTFQGGSGNFGDGKTRYQML